jgi:hypothetical protein
MMGFKAFHSAQATIAGIETAHMIRKGQLSEDNIPAQKYIGEMMWLCRKYCEKQRMPCLQA